MSAVFYGPGMNVANPMLPISFLWAPLLGIPGVRRIGERAFAADHGGRLAMPPGT